MSVTTRIRLVGAIASSMAMAVGVVVLFGVWASVSALPGILALGSAWALMGMLLTKLPYNRAAACDVEQVVGQLTGARARA